MERGKIEKIRKDKKGKKKRQSFKKQKKVVKRTLNETRKREFLKETHMLIRKTFVGVLALVVGRLRPLTVDTVWREMLSQRGTRDFSRGAREKRSSSR